MPSRQTMTEWYDPIRLAAVGIRVAEATVFGKMFDRRELIAALDPFDKSDFDASFDFSASAHLATDGNFWLDFCADTGDGWRPTHAVARLLARSELRPVPSPQGEPPVGPLLQGRVLRSPSNCVRWRDQSQLLCEPAHIGDARCAPQMGKARCSDLKQRRRL